VTQFVGTLQHPLHGAARRRVDPRACYALIDISTDVHVTFRRVTYDVATAARAIRATDLPHKFAIDLELGGAAVSQPAPEASERPTR
jgi:hypothetical protein